MIIAIDGPAAAGKGTLARSLSVHFDFAYLDTGLLYRAVSKKILDEGKNPEQQEIAEQIAKEFNPEYLTLSGLRSELVGQVASKISAIPGVRAELLNFQRTFAISPPNRKKGAILDGRDIGTTVCPQANVKIFVTASTEIRAARRLKELQERGTKAIYSSILEGMIERDRRDQERAIAPLEPAIQASVIDTSNLDRSEVFNWALKVITSN